MEEKNNAIRPTHGMVLTLFAREKFSREGHLHDLRDGLLLRPRTLTVILYVNLHGEDLGYLLMRLSSNYGCGEAYFSKLLGENLEFLQLLHNWRRYSSGEL
jgi:hypothetical protein